MRNKKVEKAKADVKRGMNEVGKAAANLKDDVKADVEWLKVNLEHNDDAEKKADANAYTEETRDNVESIFGGNAGIVWKALNLNGPMTIDDFMKATNLIPRRSLAHWVGLDVRTRSPWRHEERQGYFR